MVRLEFQIISRFFSQCRIETKLVQRNAVADDVDPVRGIAVKIGNLPLYHLRIGDDAAGAALGKKRFLELQDVAMLAVDAANKSLQRHFKFSSPVQPGLMHAVARTVNIAAPNALQTHQHIAANF